MGEWGTCSVCNLSRWSPKGSAYGNVCSRECFDKLCNDKLGISLEDFQTETTIIEYDIPIQGEEQVEKHNKMCLEMFGKDRFTPLKSTEEHAEILFDKLHEAINNVGDTGGWYVGDGIKVRIELEYDPEDK